ncbi:CAP domain-containing protein [Streptomyces sp. LP05-1]|uniref:CAP domain-containing protein n=1 Tax=Streptomyces pyxinae TaxID=2970734 RepID=A0ABT2CGP9_9ACTN|nr:CAP domain-containing protein [Streptomyces sp. LP05-1]MCS0636592.1 CAP domain-containing protein [Streptomyces sp. LP05-1]
MGRHRRSGAAPADAHPAGSHGGGTLRRKKPVVPVRTGLLGASAAIAVGAVAVASGLLPGGDSYDIGGGPSGEQVRTGMPELRTQGGTGDLRASDRASAPASRGADRSAPPGQASASPSARPSASAPSASAPSSSASAIPKSPAKPSTTPPKSRTAEPVRPKQPEARPERTRSAAPSRTATAAPSREPAGTPSAGSGREQAAEAAVLTLVNAERAKVGCSPLRFDPDLAALAGAFSRDMAKRDFFAHTSPDGASPWDRAATAGVSGLGAENIARGQADAEAVMATWMTSEGHRANILNCDYTRLGVGVHFGDGGPWWTQDFGF